MKNDILKTLIHEDEIKEKIVALGKKITEDYKDKRPVLISILKGSIIFMSDLVRQVDTYCDIDFMVVSSYGSGMKTSGIVKIVKDMEIDINNRDVLIVEDILDSGLTLSYLKDILASRNPKSIEICTLLDKPERHQVDIFIKYKGFDVPNEFVVGYGLDYDELYRNLPYIGILKPEIYL